MSEIERRMAELSATQLRVQQERAQKRLEQQTAANRLRVVDAEVRRLDEEQARLARDFLRDDAAMMARAEPRAERRAGRSGRRRGTRERSPRSRSTVGRSNAAPLGRSGHAPGRGVVAPAAATGTAAGAAEVAAAAAA